MSAETNPPPPPSPYLSDRLRQGNISNQLLAEIYINEATELDDAARIANDHGRVALADVIDAFAAHLRRRASEIDS